MSLEKLKLMMKVRWRWKK